VKSCDPVQVFPNNVVSRVRSRDWLFVAALEFCLVTRFWRQKSQVAVLLELVSDSHRDGIDDRNRVRYRRLTKVGFFDAECEFCRGARSSRQKSQVASLLEVATDAISDGIGDGNRIRCSRLSTIDTGKSLQPSSHEI
jgi:hypothetical protein